MKRILIIGASILQLPAILKAKEMGYYVATADYNPEAVGIPFADEYFNVSTIDVDGVVKAAQEFGADGIMTLATDMPMRAVARACEVLGLNGISFETAVKATDKGEMIKAFEEHGVEHPWYFVAKDPDSFEQIFDKVTYPCIMKPTDNAGSRGVVKCNSAEELREAYSYSSGESRGGAVIVEEYLQGPEFSIEVMVTDGVADFARDGQEDWLTRTLPTLPAAAPASLARRVVEASVLRDGGRPSDDMTAVCALIRE